MENTQDNQQISEQIAKQLQRVPVLQKNILILEQQASHARSEMSEMAVVIDQLQGRNQQLESELEDLKSDPAEVPESVLLQESES